MNFAKKCRELRMKKAATQEQMATALNLSSQAISKWETGLTLPDITLLPEISVYFGVMRDGHKKGTVDFEPSKSTVPFCK